MNDKRAFYVYKYVVGGVLWYIGSGSDRRDTHHMRLAAVACDTPRLPGMRDWYLDLAQAISVGVPVEISRIKEGLTKAESLAMEQQLIEHHHPMKNTHGTIVTGRQGVRMIKLECPACGYVLRTTRKWVAVGAPSCCCGAGPLPVVSDRSTPKHKVPCRRVSTPSPGL